MSGKSKEKDVVPASANLPVNMEEEIRKQLAEQKNQLGSLPVNKISTRGKEFTLPDGRKGTEIEVVILDFAWFMVNYPGVFNANNPQSPDCFAVGRENPDSGKLKPHENVSSPHHDNCAECPKNQWGSSPAGKGKACKNQRRLVVIGPDAEDATEIMSLYVSPGGLKHFDAYVSRLANEHKVLPVQVVTRITFDPNQTYPLLNFEMVGPHDNMNLFWAKREQAQEMLFRPIELQAKEAA
jgi:hypothetical protein